MEETIQDGPDVFTETPAEGPAADFYGFVSTCVQHLKTETVAHFHLQNNSVSVGWRGKPKFLGLAADYEPDLSLDFD